MNQCSRPQRAGTTSHQRSTLPTSRQGHDLSSGLEVLEPRVLTCRRPSTQESAGWLTPRHTERISLLIAHRPGFVAPTLAARSSPRSTSSAAAALACTRSPAATTPSSARRRLPREGRALRAHRRVPPASCADLGVRGALQPRGHVLQVRGPLRRDQARAPHPALLRRLLRGGLPGRRPARGHLRALGRAAGGDRRADRGGARGGAARPAAPTAAASPCPSARSSPRPTSSPGSAPTDPRLDQQRTRRVLLGQAQGLGRTGTPENVGSQRLLAAADRATGTTARCGPPRQGHRRRRQLDRAGRQPGDGRRRAARLRGHRRRPRYDPDPRLRPAQDDEPSTTESGVSPCSRCAGRRA
jgi:hypothetical protein